MKNGDFPISYVNVYQRVITFFLDGSVSMETLGIPGESHMVICFFLACLDMVDGIDDGFYRWFIPL